MTNISPTFLKRMFGSEEPLLAIRPHWVEMLPSLLLIPSATLSFLGFLFFVISPFFPSFHIPLALALGCVGIGVIASLIVIGSWYFHGYVVTKGRILEFHSLPLLLHNSNGILLNQVRCTEIDVSKNGLFQHLFDIGDITITFDRPTRTEHFILTHVFHPEKIGDRLGSLLDSKENISAQTIHWSKNTLGKHQLLFHEDFYAPAR